MANKTIPIIKLEESNVGIGTTNIGSLINFDSTYFRPNLNAKFLDIYSDTNEADINLISNNSGNNSGVGGIYFTRARGQIDAHLQVAAIKAVQVGTGGGNQLIAGGKLNFYTKSDGGGTAEASPAMTINSDGNVGIGATVPISKLQISGAGQTIMRLDSASLDNVAQFQAKAAGQGVLVAGMYGPNPVAGTVFGANTSGAAYLGTSTLGTIHPNLLVIGNVAGIPIIFSTSNTERMRIQPVGNVGIGTTNPLALLSVGNGSLADTNVPVQISSSGPGTERWFGANRNGGYGLILGYYEGTSLAGSGAYVRQVTSDPLHFTVNGTTTAMSIISNGDVGIGTTTPATDLDVNGAMIVGLNNAYGALTRTPAGVIKPWFATASANTFFYNTNVSGSTFWRNAADTATLMSLTEQARLGINTADPSGRLHVLDTVLYPPSLTWNSTAAAIIRSENGQIAFGSDDTTPYGIWQQVRTSSSTARPLLLNPLGGNVGVGVRNPTKKLHVVGSLYWDYNGTTAEEHSVAIQRTVAFAAGSFTEIGSLAPSANSIRATFEIFHHDCGTIEYSMFELIANYYAGATTDWVQLPSRTQSHYAGGPNGVVVDARLTADNAAILLRLRSLGGACGNMLVNVRIKSNTNLTESSATGTGATVAGLLGFNRYEFPVTDNRFKATTEGLFIKNNGFIGIGSTNPQHKLQISGGSLAFTTSTGLAVPMLGITNINVAYIGPYTTSTDGNAPTLVAFNQGASVQQTWFYSSGRVAMTLNREGRLNIAGNAGNTPPALLNIGPDSSTTAVSGLSFGNDAQANLYRSAEDTIKTDGSLNVAGLIYNSNSAYYSSLSKTTNANWGQYTIVLGNASYSSQLVQVSVNGGNVVWAGTFLVSSHISYRPTEVWNNVKLLEYSTYNSNVDDVTLLVMSNTATNAYGAVSLVLKTNGLVNGGYGTGYANTIAVTSTGPAPNEFVLSSSSWSSPYTYTIANSANTKQIYTTEAGNVGIGTTGPVVKLEVAGALRVTGVGQIGPANGYGFALFNGGTNTFAGQLYGRANGIQFTDNIGGNTVYIASGGNVGIGLTNPSFKLEIAAGTSNAVVAKLTQGYERVRYNGFDLLGYNDGTLWMMGNNNTNTIVLSNNWDWDYQIGIAYTPGSIGVAGGVLQIGQLTKNNANYTHGITALFTSGVERLRVNNIGNVGINVTNPTYKLQVAGNFAFDGGLSTRMLVSYTNLTNTEDWQNSPISIRERDQVGNTQLADKYGPNLNFHWASRVSKSFWMDANGILNWGEYDANGIPYADGTFKTATLLATTSVGVGTTIPSGLLHAYISDARYFTFSNTAAFTIQRNVITTAGGTPVLSLINTQGMDVGSTNRGTSIQLDLGYGGNGTNLVGTAARGARIAALNDTVYDSTAANQNASLVFYTATGGSLTEKLRIQGDNKVGIGVTSPVTLLSVGGAGSTSAASGITFGADASANLYRDTTSRIRTDGAFISSSYIFAGTYLQTSNGNIFPANFSTDIVLNVGNAAANNWETYPFTLKKGGYVGIGTNIPSGKLHVVSSVANETVLRADGTNGILFSVVDDLSDSLMSVNNSAGLPVLEVFANDRVVMGQYGANDFVLINNKIGLGTNNPQYELDIVGAGTNAAVNIITRMRSTAGSDVFNTASVLAFTNTTTNSNAYSYIGGRIDLGGAGDNAQSLVFATNATNTLPTEKMRITSAGNVGIGITNPSQKLHVIGDIGLYKDGSNSILGWLYLANAANTRAFNFQLNSDGSRLDLWSFNSANAWQNSVSFNYNGNVGINQTSPTSKLHIVETTQTGVKIQFGTATASAIMNAGQVNHHIALFAPFNANPASVSNNGAKWGIIMHGSLDNINADIAGKAAAIYAVSEEDAVGGAGYNRKVGLALHTSAFDLANAERVRIRNDGNVGIGSTNPSYKLEVYSAAKTSTFVGLSINNFNNYDGTAASLVKSQLRFAILESPTDTYNAASRTFASCEAGNEAANSSSDGFFAISTRSTALVTEKFRINSAGNVGVGLTNPAYRLQVSGDLSIASQNILRFGTVAVLNESSNANDIYANIRVIRNKSSTLNDGMYVNYDSNGTTAAHLRFYANGTTERMRIQANNGFVGIGTATAVGRLDVYDDTDAGHVSFVRNNNSGINAYTAIVLRRNGDTNGLVMFTNSSNRLTDGGVANSTIRTDNGKLLLGAGATTYHSLETNGNVGIGVTNPNAARLHIKGDTTNPVIRVETNLIEGPAGGTAGRTLRGWLPIMTGANAGDKVYIPLYGPLN